MRMIDGDGACFIPNGRYESGELVYLNGMAGELALHLGDAYGCGPICQSLKEVFKPWLESDQISIGHRGSWATKFLLARGLGDLGVSKTKVYEVFNTVRRYLNTYDSDKFSARPDVDVMVANRMGEQLAKAWLAKSPDIQSAVTTDIDLTYVSKPIPSRPDDLAFGLRYHKVGSEEMLSEINCVLVPTGEARGLDRRFVPNSPYLHHPIVRWVIDSRTGEISLAATDGALRMMLMDLDEYKVEMRDDLNQVAVFTSRMLLMDAQRRRVFRESLPNSSWTIPLIEPATIQDLRDYFSHMSDIQLNPQVRLEVMKNITVACAFLPSSLRSIYWSGLNGILSDSWLDEIGPHLRLLIAEDSEMHEIWDCLDGMPLNRRLISLKAIFCDDERVLRLVSNQQRGNDFKDLNKKVLRWMMD